MELNQLKYLVEICNCGSITKAAAKVHITQQGLSSSIRRLEAELGCDLFYRKAGTLILTDVGTQVYKEAQKLLRHVSNIYEICNSSKWKYMPVHVTISHSILPRLSPKFQKMLLSGFPDVQVSLREAYSVECVEAVENDDTDFALIYGKIDNPNIDSVNIDNLKQVFIVNKSHHLANRKTVRLEELDSLPFIAPEEPSYPRKMLNDMFKKKNLTLNVVYSCGRPRQVIELIANNPLLISRVVVNEVTPADMDRISILELDNLPFTLPISMIYKRGKVLNPPEKLFYSYACEGESQ